MVFQKAMWNDANAEIINQSDAGIDLKTFIIFYRFGKTIIIVPP
jgi:hypothetical protein